MKSDTRHLKFPKNKQTNDKQIRRRKRHFGSIRDGGHRVILRYIEDSTQKECLEYHRSR